MHESAFARPPSHALAKFFDHRFRRRFQGLCELEQGLQCRLPIAPFQQCDVIRGELAGSRQALLRELLPAALFSQHSPERLFDGDPSRQVDVTLDQL